MSLSEKHNKCTYCNSSKSEKKLETKEPRVASEYVRRANARGLYEVPDTARI
jgi:2-iminoacetate synthase ThiH